MNFFILARESIKSNKKLISKIIFVKTINFKKAKLDIIKMEKELLKDMAILGTGMIIFGIMGYRYLTSSLEKIESRKEEEKEKNLSIDAACPAKLEKIEFSIVPYEHQKRVVCRSYEMTRGVSKVPSEEFCRMCRYNTDNLRREADERLQLAYEKIKVILDEAR